MTVEERLLAIKQRSVVFHTLDELASKYSVFSVFGGNWLPTDILIITGMARGADIAGYDWAVANRAQIAEFPADWGRYGAAAGPIRNKQMLDEGVPDLVVAFPGGKGTENMKKQARNTGVEVMEITFNG